MRLNKHTWMTWMNEYEPGDVLINQGSFLFPNYTEATVVKVGLDDGEDDGEILVAAEGRIERSAPINWRYSYNLTDHEPAYAAAHGDEPPPGYVEDPKDGKWYRVETAANVRREWLERHNRAVNERFSAVSPGEMALCMAAGETQENVFNEADAYVADDYIHRPQPTPADTERDERIAALREAQEKIREAIELIRDALRGMPEDDRADAYLIPQLEMAIDDEHEWVGGNPGHIEGIIQSMQEED